MYQSSDDGLETRAVFLDKVWHQGLLFKLKQNGISGNLTAAFFYQRKQRVVLNGQHSSWIMLKQGSPRDYPWIFILSDLYQRLI